MLNCKIDMVLNIGYVKDGLYDLQLDDAQKFISLGASRLGTSRIIKIIKNEEAHGY